jgi:hypothetical protein
MSSRRSSFNWSRDGAPTLPSFLSLLRARRFITMLEVVKGCTPTAAEAPDRTPAEASSTCGEEDFDRP